MRGRRAGFVRQTCSVELCDQPARGKGFCQPHYMRWLRHGDPLAGGPRHRPAAEWSASPAYDVWANMRQRCEDPASTAYSNYGGRGIAVCERWKDFGAFLEDMGQPPAGMTIERCDNNRGYEPDNCRWATPLEQGRNKRNNRLLTIGSETQPMSVWAERAGLKVGTLHARLKHGWPPSIAVALDPIEGPHRCGIPKHERSFVEMADGSVVVRGHPRQPIPAREPRTLQTACAICGAAYMTRRSQPAKTCSIECRRVLVTENAGRKRVASTSNQGASL